MYKSYVGVRFNNGARAYFFGVKHEDNIELNDYVVVETIRGLELGQVVISPVDITNYNSDFGLKPVIRKASDVDLRIHQNNLKDAQIAMEICQAEVKRLGLDMNLISCEYTLDKSKVIFSFLSDDRVDFRELLKSLAAKLRARIELRQIGTRDKAKMIGGIGVCGLPLCCARFLNEFDGISISRAKNQMLAINIPKLSGHCGKLICCLKFEDDAYTDARKEFPELGTKVWLDKKEYTITSYNVISGIVKIEGDEDEIQFVHINELKKNGKFRKKEKNEKK
ncbi:MAG: stage 0 sporulation protein [Bacilli bacterium]|nr:stage 0 sporulation protein [Bacilli bacterium]